MVYKDGSFQMCDIKAGEDFPKEEGDKKTIYKKESDDTEILAGELKSI